MKNLESFEKYWLGATVWLLFLGLLLALSPESASARDLTTKPYRVGVIIPLSGPVASMGAYLRNGIELALEDLPPERRKLVEFVFEDDQFDVPKTVSSYQKLSAVGGLDAILVLGSPPANALAPIVERKQQLLIAVGASDPSIVAGRKNSFIHWVTPPVLGKLLGEELKRRDFQRIAFLTAEASGTIADMEAAIAALKELGLSDRVVYQETVAKDQTDFRTLIAKLKSLRPEAVVVVLFPGSLSAFTKQARSAGLAAELVGMETFEDETEVKVAEGTLDGTWFVNAATPSEQFIKRYRDRYATYPGWAAANAYDSVILLGAAVQAGSGQIDPVRSYLQTLTDFAGAAGTYSASGDNRFTLPAMLKRVTPDGFVALER